MNIPNLAFLRNIPDWGGRLYEALVAVQGQATTIEKQVNGNAGGQPAAPPAIDAINVTGQNGHFNVSIQDNGQISRGVRYYVEHDTSPDFANPHVVPLGDSRNANLFLGNQTLYFRAYSAYSSSPPSSAAYHGDSTAPRPVSGGGSVGSPARLASQGSGTGAPGVGLSGPGPIPRRDPTSGVSWQQQRSGVSGISLDIGSTPQQLAVIGGAGQQVAGGSLIAPSITSTFSTSTTLGDIPVGLGAADVGRVYFNSFFGRSWIWTGAAWHYADGGAGAGAQVATSGAAPSGGLWAPCNGVPVSCALDNATLASLTPSNTSASGGNNPMIEGGPGGAQQAPTASTLSVNVAVGIGTLAAGNDSGTGTIVQSGTGATVADHPHSHGVSGAPAVTQQPTINAPSEANGGLPLRVSMQFWMRR